LLEDEEDRSGAGEQIFVGEFGVYYYIDGVEIGGVGVVAGQCAGGQRALQPGEPESCVAIAAEGELDEAVTESADAVVEEDGVGHLP
jgi:hypothetical protein